MDPLTQLHIRLLFILRKLMFKSNLSVWNQELETAQVVFTVLRWNSNQKIPSPIFPTEQPSVLGQAAGSHLLSGFRAQEIELWGPALTHPILAGLPAQLLTGDLLSRKHLWGGGGLERALALEENGSHLWREESSDPKHNIFASPLISVSTAALSQLAACCCVLSSVETAGRQSKRPRQMLACNFNRLWWKWISYPPTPQGETMLLCVMPSLDFTLHHVDICTGMYCVQRC